MKVETSSQSNIITSTFYQFSQEMNSEIINQFLKGCFLIGFSIAIGSLSARELYELKEELVTQGFSAQRIVAGTVCAGLNLVSFKIAEIGKEVLFSVLL